MSAFDSGDPLFRPVSIDRAMQITGRSRRTIDRWIKDGHLRLVRIENPPEVVIVERELVELEKARRDGRARGRPPRSDAHSPGVDAGQNFGDPSPGE